MMDAGFETMSDEELLSTATMELPGAARYEMVELIEIHHERELTREERSRLDTLMQNYRRGLVRKAQAIDAAVERGLMPPA